MYVVKKGELKHKTYAAFSKNKTKYLLLNTHTNTIYIVIVILCIHIYALGDLIIILLKKLLKI